MKPDDAVGSYGRLYRQASSSLNHSDFPHTLKDSRGATKCSLKRGLKETVFRQEKMVNDEESDYGSNEVPCRVTSTSHHHV